MANLELIPPNPTVRITESSCHDPNDNLGRIDQRALPLEVTYTEAVEAKLSIATESDAEVTALQQALFLKPSARQGGLFGIDAVSMSTDGRFDLFDQLQEEGQVVLPIRLYRDGAADITRIWGRTEKIGRGRKAQHFSVVTVVDSEMISNPAEQASRIISIAHNLARVASLGLGTLSSEFPAGKVMDVAGLVAAVRAAQNMSTEIEKTIHPKLTGTASLTLEELEDRFKPIDNRKPNFRLTSDGQLIIVEANPLIPIEA